MQDDQPNDVRQQKQVAQQIMQEDYDILKALAEGHTTITYLPSADERIAQELAGLRSDIRELINTIKEVKDDTKKS